MSAPHSLSVKLASLVPVDGQIIRGPLCFVHGIWAFFGPTLVANVSHHIIILDHNNSSFSFPLVEHLISKIGFKEIVSLVWLVVVVKEVCVLANCYIRWSFDHKWTCEAKVWLLTTYHVVLDDGISSPSYFPQTTHRVLLMATFFFCFLLEPPNTSRQRGLRRHLGPIKSRWSPFWLTATLSSCLNMCHPFLGMAVGTMFVLMDNVYHFKHTKTCSTYVTL